MNKEHHVGCCFAWKLENSRGNACFDDNRNLQANVCEKYGFVIILHLWSEVFFSQVKMNTQKINTPLFIREKNWKKERKKNARTNWKLFSIKGRNIHKMTLQKSFTFSDLLCNLFILGKISSSITLLIKLQTPSMCWIEFNSISTLA